MHFHLVPCCTFSFFFLCGERRKHLSRLPTHKHRHFAQKKEIISLTCSLPFSNWEKKMNTHDLFFPHAEKRDTAWELRKRRRRNTIRTHMGITAARELLRLYTHPFFPQNIYNDFFFVCSIPIWETKSRRYFFFSALAQKESVWKRNGRRRRPIYFPSLSSPLHCREPHFNIRRRGGEREGA